jgi:signal transduction histidine kinase
VELKTSKGWGNEGNSIFESSADIILKVNHQGVILNCFAGNTSVIQNTGEYSGKNLNSNDLIDGVALNIVTHIRQSLLDNKIHSIEFENIYGNRAVKVDLYIIPVVNNEAMLIIKSIPSSNDIISLAQSTHLRLLAKKLPGGIVFIFDSSLKYLLAEGEGLGLLGLTKENIEGTSLQDSETIDEQHTFDLAKSAYEHALQGKVTNTRFELKNKGKWFHVTVFPLAEVGKKIEAGMVIAFDITSLIEIEMQTANALKALEEKNRQLEDFNFVTSNDLQEPLRMVTSFTQLLARKYHGILDDEAAQFIEYALEGAQRIKTIIRDIITYIRVDKNHVSHAKISPIESIELVKNELMLDIIEKKAEIIVDELPDVYFDFGQLTEVFKQLISNSLKFNNSNPRIHISYAETEDEISFLFKDNGIGISTEYQKTIFDLFQRLNSREKFTGNGLGLAITRNIIERRGGSIKVESDPGKGSTFYLSFPKKS